MCFKNAVALANHLQVLEKFISANDTEKLDMILEMFINYKQFNKKDRKFIKQLIKELTEKRIKNK